MKIIIIVITLFIFNFTYSQNLKIRIFSEKNINSFIFATNNCDYNIYSDSTLIIKLIKNDLVYLKIKNDSIEIKTLTNSIGTFKSLKMIGDSEVSSFNINIANSDKQLRTYNNNLYVSVLNKNIKLINEVNIDNYIAGVVECEGGYKANIEYYKTQSIICRTYALENLSRHIEEGFYLCDNVHCQVYKGICKSKIISEASVTTSGLVIVDSTLNLINAAFHSNCGGQTASSEDVWLTPKSYLKSVTDSFCVKNKNAKWEKSISYYDFKQYLMSNGFNIQNVTDTNIFNFQQTYRKTYYKLLNDSILFRKMRTDLNLKSAFFNISYSNNKITFNGKGYGHGVGLCQEGAMRMANFNYGYKDIIKFYYKNTYIVNINSLEQFKPK